MIDSEKQYEPTVIELFAGIRGFSIGFEAEGFRTIGVSEINSDKNIVGSYHYPDVPNFGDITKPDFSARILATVGRPSVIVGGPPCQSVSTLGNRRGTADARWLWGDAIRVVGELRPRFCVFENPPAVSFAKGNGDGEEGINGTAFNGIVSGLAEIGYDCLWTPIPAALFGAGHLRFRLIIIGADSRHATNAAEQKRQCDEVGREQFSGQLRCVQTSADVERESGWGRFELQGEGIRRRPVDENGKTSSSNNDCLGHEGPGPVGFRSDETPSGKGRQNHSTERSYSGPTLADADWQRRCEQENEIQSGRKTDDCRCPDMRGRVTSSDWWMETNTGIPVLVHGISPALAQASARCTGDAIVPQVAQAVARAIRQII